MTISDECLKDREKRHLQIEDLLKTEDLIISIKVNMPGKDKSNYLAYLILNSFSLDFLNIDYRLIGIYDSFDGPYILLSSNDEPNQVKEKTIFFEMAHALGRFLDIDVYTKEKQLSRNEKRKCYLCDLPAHVCARAKTHSYDELISHIEESVLFFYENRLHFLINDAMIEELELEPKFGLVTKNTQGSHQDMDYHLMISVKDMLLPYFVNVFNHAIRIKDHIDVSLFKELGKEAEKLMYKLTFGVNCYKGLIFHMGLLVLSYGYYLSRPSQKCFFDTVREIASLFLDKKEESSSFGDYADKNYHIQGAKGEALSGYKHVQDVLKLGLKDDLLILIEYIIRIEDTNLLKRAKSLEEYLRVKKSFKDLDKSNKNEIEKLSKKCIEQGLTFGGSADLLVVSKVIKEWLIIHEKITL
jgi:holo-ACP synthase CitX